MVRRGAAALGVALLVAGCGDCGPRPTSAPAPPPRAAEPAPLPEAGGVRVSRSGDRYTVLASGAAPADVLAELSVAAGFRVEQGDEAPAAPLRLALQDVPLERALAAILPGVAYQVHYEFADGDPSPERPLGERPVVLTRVSVGERPQRGEAEPGAAVPAARTAEPGERDEEREQQRAEREARDRERALALDRDSRDPRASVRLEAIEQMEPDGDDRLRLAALLREDTVPEVRVAAAERLGDGDPFEVVDSLLEALADPEPEVVAAAVRSLEDVYAEAPDPRIRVAVTALREHRDAGVREAVARFEEWLDE